MNVTFGLMKNLHKVKVLYFSSNHDRSEHNKSIIKISRFIVDYSDEIVDHVNRRRYNELVQLCDEQISIIHNECFNDYKISGCQDMINPPQVYKYWLDIKDMIESTVDARTHEIVFDVVSSYINKIDWDTNTVHIDDNLDLMWNKRNTSWEIAAWVACSIVEKKQWKSVNMIMHDLRIYNRLVVNKITVSNPVYISQIRYDLLISLYDKGHVISFTHATKASYSAISMFTPNELLIHNMMFGVNA